MKPLTDDQDADSFVGLIVEQIKKVGQHRDPRQHGGLLLGDGFDDYLRGEISKSIERVHREYRPPAWLVDAKCRQPLTLADFRKAAKALKKVAFTEEQRIAVEQLEAVRQEPPERANTVNFCAAVEAYDLLTLFTDQSPSSYRCQIIAPILFEAATGKKPSDMKNACDHIVRTRRPGQATKHRHK